MALLRKLQALTAFCFARHRRRAVPARRHVRLALEALEARVTPSVYYVSPGGSDNHAGTSPSAPWQTIAQVNRFAAGSGFRPGDQVLFQGGGQSFTGNLLFPANSGGAAGNPVTIGSYSGRATLDANNAGNGLLIDSASHVVISNLTFVDGGVGTSPLADTGIFITGSGSDISIDQVEVSGFGGLGISIDTDTSNVKIVPPDGPPQDIYDFSRTGAYSDVSVTYSSLHDNGVGGLDAHSTTDLYVGHVHAYHNAGLDGYWESGFGILEFSDDQSYSHAVVEYCEVHDNGYNPQSGGACGGIELMAGAYGLLQYNESYDNRSPYDGEGVVLDATAYSVMQFNYTHGNDGWGLFLGMESWALPQYDHDNVVRYNISENDGSTTNGHGVGMLLWQDVEHSDIYNNTVFTNIGTDRSWKSAVQVANFTGNSVSVRNNLFVTAGGNAPNVNQLINNDGAGSGTNLLFQGNDYWPSGAPFTITWPGGPYASEADFYHGAGQEALNGQNVGLQLDPRLNRPGGGGTVGDADRLGTLAAYQLAGDSPLARAGLTLSQFGTAWDPYGFGSDPFLAQYFDATPRDFYGNALPASNPSVGASQVPVLPAVPVIAVAAGAGGGPEVKVLNASTQAVLFDFLAYDARFTGGVRVAVGDVTGDGYPDIVTAPGPGGGPDIHVYDGTTGRLVGQFFAFDPRFTGGSFVAVGDVDGDGRGDILIGADQGGGPNVTAFSGRDLGQTRLLSFFPYDPRFTGGVRVAAGDTTGSGTASIITGAGPGGGPNVAVYQVVNGQARVLQSYFAYDPHFSAGVYVAAGDVNGDGKADVVVGAGAGGGPNVAIFNGVDGMPLSSFFAFDLSFTGGVRVAAVGGSGRASVLAVPGPGGAPDVRALDGLSGALLDRFFAYDPAFTGGLFVAAR